VAERLGRAAELARPRYLLVELGPVRAAASDRSAWRSGAAAIETYRLRWSIDDPEQALGGRQGTRALGAEALGDLARTRREVREAVRGIGRSTPARERLNGLDGPGRSGLNAR
jgi:hypothetical protein